MSERLSAEEDAISRLCDGLHRWREDAMCYLTQVDDLIARLAAVEALVRELHIGGDLTPAGAHALLAALQSDPSQEEAP